MLFFWYTSSDGTSGRIDGISSSGNLINHDPANPAPAYMEAKLTSNGKVVAVVDLTLAITEPWINNVLFRDKWENDLGAPADILVHNASTLNSKFLIQN